jgi:hypothetical protein
LSVFASYFQGKCRVALACHELIWREVRGFFLFFFFLFVFFFFVVFFFFFFFSSGPRAYTPDAPQPVGLLCYPSVLDVPTFIASPSPRACYPRDPLATKGGTAWARIMADDFA